MIGGMDRQTLRDWVHRFNAAGPMGCWTTGRVGGAASSAVHKGELGGIVEPGPAREVDGVVRWAHRS